MMKICEGCGKLINPQTLICDYCGRDYNEKPKCDCLYDQIGFWEDTIRCCGTLGFRCKKCGNILKVNVTESLISYLERGRP